MLLFADMLMKMMESYILYTFMINHQCFAFFMFLGSCKKKILKEKLNDAS